MQISIEIQGTVPDESYALALARKVTEAVQTFSNLYDVSPDVSLYVTDGDIAPLVQIANSLGLTDTALESIKIRVSDLPCYTLVCSLSFTVVPF
jgi:hypothetical protein